ncbi:hypothetical protein BJV82DRAFT_61275 [Fennellomyces sp. T-0311]|nr:hypothetical protein BJV82DRAFT_61275 [Fennellomyces sp. T-0311]
MSKGRKCHEAIHFGSRKCQRIYFMTIHRVKWMHKYHDGLASWTRKRERLYKATTIKHKIDIYPVFFVYMTLNGFDWKTPCDQVREATNICMICQLLLSIKNGMTYQRYSGLLDTLKTIHKKALSRLVPKKTCTPVLVCAGRMAFLFFSFFFSCGWCQFFLSFFFTGIRSEANKSTGATGMHLAGFPTVDPSQPLDCWAED